MTLYEFNSLSQNERANSVWQSGRFIKSIISPGVSKALYAMTGFFAEVIFSQEGRICHIRGFKNRSCLEPYKNIGLPLLIAVN